MGCWQPLPWKIRRSLGAYQRRRLSTSVRIRAEIPDRDKRIMHAFAFGPCYHKAQPHQWRTRVRCGLGDLWPEVRGPMLRRGTPNVSRDLAPKFYPGLSSFGRLV